MLRRYLASEAYMYCGETLYNIPWMLLYFQENIFRSGMSVSERKAGCINFFAKERSQPFPCYFQEGKEILYLCVEKTGKWMDLRLDFVEHEQKYYFKDDSVKVTIAVRLSTRDRKDRQVGPDGKVFQKDKTRIVQKQDINEYRYPNLTASEKKVVKPGLQELAYKLVPEI